MISDVIQMGVAVLQLYPVQDNRTGPQVVDLLTKRIMNQGGAIFSSHFPDVMLKITQVLHRQDNSLLTVKFTRVSPRLPTFLPRICEFDFASLKHNSSKTGAMTLLWAHYILSSFQCSDTFCTTPSVPLQFSQSSKPTARPSRWPRTPSLTCWCSSWPTCTRRRPQLRAGDPGGGILSLASNQQIFFWRFEIKDFLVKLGSVTVGGVFKGILVEVE